MKKLLIVGASILQLPAIKRAKELGYHVAVIDYDPNAIGIPYADKYFNVSTIDINGVVDAAEEYKPDGIMTLATDMPMRAIAAACEKLGLLGISTETALKSTDKGKMIKAFEQNGVEHPWYYIAPDRKRFDEIKHQLTYPCIMKPTDNSGSRGVVLIHNPMQLEEEYSYSQSSSRSGSVIIEEYLTGPEVSVEVIVYKGVPHVLQITDKLTTGAPHFVEMGHSQPSQLPKDTTDKIKDLASRAVLAVGIENGPAHVEMIVTENGPKMVELGARMGGDCITTHLVPLSTGIDMIKATIDIACGNEPDIIPKFSKGSAIRYFDVPYGTIQSIDGVDAAKKIDGVKQISFTKSVGNIVGKIGSSGDRVGFVIGQSGNPQEAIALCEEAISSISIQVQ